MMSSAIKELTLIYDRVNETNTFTNGDVLQGRVFLEVSKDVHINSFYIKFKGDANVRWSERRNDRTHSYSSHERYFKLKQFFVMDPSKPEKREANIITTNKELYGNVIRPGRLNVFPFSFQLPDRDMPPSFKGYHGSVKYILEARLDRSWMIDKTAVKEINFVPKIAAGAKIMTPQRAAVDKKMTLFTSGSASMTATIDKRSYVQGDVIRVSTNVDNSSSRELKLKYSLQQKQIFHAQGRTNYSLETIFKLVGDPIPKGSKKTVNKDLIIPSNVDYNFENCSIIKLEYTFKVYLDVPYATDPAIKFPVVILSAGQPCQPRPPAQSEFGLSPPGAGFGRSPAGATFGHSHPGAAFGHSHPGAAFGHSRPGAAFGHSHPGAAFGHSHPGAAFGHSRPGAAFGRSPPGAAFERCPPGPVFGRSPPGAAFGCSPPGAAFGHSPPGATFGPAPPLYPSPVCPQPASPLSPPPLYTDIYPDQNPLFPAFQSASPAPALSPPSYSSVSYPGPAGQAASTTGSSPNSGHSSTQPESYPTKPPEKHA